MPAASPRRRRSPRCPTRSSSTAPRGSHNSVAVEMRDHVVLFEAPLGDGRANAVMNAVKAALPGKPIRYVVASHHHFDHSGGLRAAAAEGAVIVMPEASKGYFERAYMNTHLINPDSLAKSGRSARFETYGDKHVLSDGTRTLELYLIKNNLHSDGYVLGYLPKEKIIIQADAFSPRAPITQTPAVINPSTKNLTTCRSTPCCRCTAAWSTCRSSSSRPACADPAASRLVSGGPSGPPFFATAP